jgi:hypothetical protein
MSWQLLLPTDVALSVASSTVSSTTNTRQGPLDSLHAYAYYNRACEGDVDEACGSNGKAKARSAR